MLNPQKNINFNKYLNKIKLLFNRRILEENKMNSQRAPQGGGLWNTNRPVVSSDTQNLLKSKNQCQMYRFFSN